MTFFANNNKNFGQKRSFGHPNGAGAGDHMSQLSNESCLEARISIHINDESIPKEQYDSYIKQLCMSFGKIKTTHIPKKRNNKKGNLIFVEFTEEK